MQNLFEDLKSALINDDRFIADGQLLKNKIIECALNLDAGLLGIIVNVPSLKSHFFQIIGQVLVFDKIKFQQFIANKSFLPNSYTAYKNKIGLVADGKYLTDAQEVVLAWPYKDCILEGGQTKDDDKRREVFHNETLAPDEIDRLLSPKAFVNFRRYDINGMHDLSRRADEPTSRRADEPTSRRAEFRLMTI